MTNSFYQATRIHYLNEPRIVPYTYIEISELYLPLHRTSWLAPQSGTSARVLTLLQEIAEQSSSDRLEHDRSGSNTQRHPRESGGPDAADSRFRGNDEVNTRFNLTGSRSSRGFNAAARNPITIGKYDYKSIRANSRRAAGKRPGVQVADSRTKTKPRNSVASTCGAPLRITATSCVARYESACFAVPQPLHSFTFCTENKRPLSGEELKRWRVPRRTDRTG